jgi:hypothetical protein
LRNNWCKKQGSPYGAWIMSYIGCYKQVAPTGQNCGTTGVKNRVAPTGQGLLNSFCYKQVASAGQKII